MLTVTAKLQYDQCRKEINKLQYEQHVIANQKECIMSQLTPIRAEYEQYKKDHKDEDIGKLEDNPTYCNLAAKEDALDTRKEAIESELKLLNEEMTNFQKLHEQGITESTTFWCFGGS